MKELKEKGWIPKGRIRIVDDVSGKVLVDTHNMIVESGRRLIGAAVFDPTESKDILSPDNFTMFFESGDTLITKATMTYHDIKDNILTGSVLSITDKNIDAGNTCQVKYDVTNNYYYFKKKIQPVNDYLKISYLGTLYDGSASGLSSIMTSIGITADLATILFSRAMINPQYLRNTHTYTVTYLFYF